MRFLLLLFGGLLMAAGTAAMLFGLDIVQMERGWSALISGATVFAAGAIIAALAGVVAKLDQVAGAIHWVQASAPAHSEIAAAAPIETAVMPEAVLSEPLGRDQLLDSAPVLPALEPLEGDGHGAINTGYAAPIASVLEPPPIASAPETDRTDAHEDKPAAPVEGAAETSFDWLERALAADAGTAARLHSETPRAADPSALAQPPLSKSEPPPFASKPEPPREREDLFLPPDLTKPRLATGSKGEGATQPRRSEPTPASVQSEVLAPTAADPAILGRYQANGNSYVMFCDGSIEAVTQTGVYRFNSMAELKAFIEAQA
jgi:hypothetical protein